jgi:protein-arginine deiminase
VRLWHDGEVVLGDDVATWEVPESTEDLALQVEVGRTAHYARLALRRLDKQGEQKDVAWLALRSAPLILNHHLLPTEHVWLMAVEGGAQYENRQMDFDVWVQDEMQLGNLTAPGVRHDHVLDSIRDRGLDALAKSLRGPDAPLETYGKWRDANTYDSFGNLEVSPPVTVAGVEYPYGRVYFGSRVGAAPHEDVVAFLYDQAVQAPVELDTSWLCIGHVDEYVSFLPDPSRDKGFVVAFADTRAAYTLIDGLDGETALPRYAPEGIEQGHGYGTLEDIRGDAALRALNDDVQRDHLDPIREQMKEAFGLTDDDFVFFPTLFEEAYFCDGGVAAMTPGMVNLVVADAGGQTHVFMADPFLRDGTDETTQADDPLIAAVNALLPAHLVPHYVDDWNVYHMGLGEVHCGTNTRRTPAGAWWEDAMHLVTP